MGAGGHEQVTLLLIQLRLPEVLDLHPLRNDCTDDMIALSENHGALLIRDGRNSGVQFQPEADDAD